MDNISSVNSHQFRQGISANELGRALIASGIVSEAELLARSPSADDPSALPSALPPVAQAFARAIEALSLPISWLIDRRLIVWFGSGAELNVAGACVFEPETQSAIRRHYSGEIRLWLVGEHDCDQLLQGIANRGTDFADEAYVLSPDALVDEHESFASVLAEARRAKASELHVEPFDTRTTMRIKVDGVLNIWRQFPRSLGDAITGQARSFDMPANCGVTGIREQRRNILLDEAAVDVRITTASTPWGDTLVVRLPDQSRLPASLESLGLGEDDLSRILKMVGRASGLLLFSGPVGAGKSSAMRSLLGHLANPTTKIVAIADCLEPDLPGMTQLNLANTAALDPVSTANAILRLSPDIVFLGDIHNAALGKVAEQLALSGQLVIGAVTAGSCGAAIWRLVELGMNQLVLAEILVGVVNQRLVRRVCGACQHTGCDECSGTGLGGQIIAAEVQATTTSIRLAIREGAGIDRLADIARTDGSRSIGDDARGKARRGLTTMAEVDRVIGR